MYASIFLLTPASLGHWFKQNQNYLWGIYQNYLAALYTHPCFVRYPKSTKIQDPQPRNAKKTPLNRPSGYKPCAFQCLSFDEMIVQNFGWAHCIWRSSCWTWWPCSTFVSLLMSYIVLFAPVLSSASSLRSFAKCVVPENIDTPTTEDSLICTPHPPGFSVPGGLWRPPLPPGISIIFKRGLRLPSFGNSKCF